MFCLHGAGDSAASFACLGKELKNFATLIAFDFRSHGASKIESEDFSCETLLADAKRILDHVMDENP